jgi:hypothetical protein
MDESILQRLGEDTVRSTKLGSTIRSGRNLRSECSGLSTQSNNGI